MHNRDNIDRYIDRYIDTGGTHDSNIEHLVFSLADDDANFRFCGTRRQVRTEDRKY